MDRTAFETFHPVVPAALFAGLIVLTMFCLEPRLVASSLACALLFSLAVQGMGAVLDKLRWQLPLLVLIGVINPLYSARGATLLFRVGPFLVYGESIAFGLTMGALLIAVLAWIEGMAVLVGSDELLALGGGALPTASLAASMALRLVPQLIARAAMVRTALLATTSARNPRSEKASRVRVMDVLMSWALEDSLERGDAMRARGWGASPRRSSYDAHPFRTRDLLALALASGLITLAAFCVHDIVAAWQFYPQLAGTAPAWLFLPVEILFAAPVAAVCLERLRWVRQP